MPKIGKLVIISGPSGVGKGTICKEILKNKDLKLILSVSMTTRKKRKDEIEGKNYFFVTKDKFKKNIIENKLLEYTKFIDNYYGTPKKYCFEKILNGNNILLEIEIDGATQIMKKINDNIVSIFLVPPNIEELEKRIRERGSESEEIIQKRLKKASLEMKLTNKYKYVVVNTSLKQTINEITLILKGELL